MDQKQTTNYELLTNDELFNVCKIYFDPGPISDDLRRIYINKLERIQENKNKNKEEETKPLNIAKKKKLGL